MTADVVSRLVDGVEVFALLDVRGPFFEPVRAAFTGATDVVLTHPTTEWKAHLAVSVVGR